MIILVLSTPRSGSHYYSEYIQSQYPNSIIMHEILSRAYKDLYLEQIGIIEHSSTEYDANSYYEDLSEGVVRVYNKRPDKEQFFESILNRMVNSSNTFIVHEHVSLIPKHWIEKLIEHSDSVSYLHRDRKEQIASRMIAGYTGVFIIRDNYMLCHGDIRNKSMYNFEKFDQSLMSPELIKRHIMIYEDADRLMSELNVNFVSYDSLIKNNNSSTKKLHKSSFDRLCLEDQMAINNVLGCD